MQHTAAIHCCYMLMQDAAALSNTMVASVAYAH